MPFSVVSDGLRQQLEQERSRLMTEREAIIEAAVAQATADIEQAIANLNSLLNGEPAAEEAAPTNGRKRGRGVARAPKETAPAKSTARAAKAKPAAPARGKAAAVEGKSKARAVAPAVELPMKRQYKNLSATQATYKLLESAPDQTFSTDEVIASIFSSLNEEQQAAARKSIGLVLGRGTYQGKIDKVQENPNLFKFKPQD